MPCNQKRIATVNLAMASIDALKAGADMEGITLHPQEDGRIAIRRNYLTIGIYTPGKGLDIYVDGDESQAQQEANQAQYKSAIARAVSHGAVKLQAKKYGWQVSLDKQGRYVVQKGR